MAPWASPNFIVPFGGWLVMLAAMFYDYFFAKKIPHRIITQYLLGGTVVAIGASSPRFFLLTIVGVILVFRAVKERLRGGPP